MTHPQQPDGWSDPSWPTPQPTDYPPVGTGQPVNPMAVSGPPVYPAYGYPVVAPRNNGMAIASMVVSIVAALGLCGYGLGGYLGILGAILGHVSKRQIRQRGETGEGMATAGIVVGWISTGLAVIATIVIIVVAVILANEDPSTFSPDY